MAVAIGLAVGPSLGGLITATLGWRWLFYINLPVAAAAIVAARRVLPDDRPTAGGKLDLPGSALGFVGLLLLLLLANQSERFGPGSPAFLAGTALAVTVTWAFIRVESRHPQPTLHLILFKNRPFSLAVAASTLSFMVQFTVVFVTPFLLQRVIGLSPAGVGLVMTASPAAMLIAAPISGALSDRFGTRPLATAGAGIVLAGIGLLAAIPLAPTPLDVAWRLALLGLGSSVFMSPNSSAAMGSAPRERLGQASAVLATVRNVGMSLGVAIASGVFSVRYAGALATGLVGPLAFVTAARQTLAVGAVFAVLSLLAAAASPGVEGARPVRRQPG